MHIQRALSIPLLVIHCAGAAAVATAQQRIPAYVVVSHSDVNLRTGPSRESEVVAHAQKGDVFVCTGEVGDWFEVEMFSDDRRYISKARAYLLTASQIVPGHRLRLPRDTIVRSLYASIQWAADRADVEAAKLLPASVDVVRHRALRNLILDRLVFDLFDRQGEQGVQPAVYRALLDDMGAGRDTLPPVEDILTRHLEAVGGREAVERCTTRVLVGRFVTDLPSWRPPVYEESRVEVRSVVGRGFLWMEHTADGVRWSGHDGDVSWSRDESGHTRHDRPDRRLAWLVDPQNAIRFRAYFPRLTLRGTRMLEGRRAYVIDIDDDRSHALHFDAESGLLVRLGYYREVGDYRVVDGVLVPFRVSESRKGGSSTYLVESIRHNVVVDPRKFGMPPSER